MEELVYKKKSSYELAPEKTEAAFAFAKDYMRFLDSSKTEREAVETAVAAAEAAGFTSYKLGDAVKVGDRRYLNNRGKSLILFRVGSESLNCGIRITAAQALQLQTVYAAQQQRITLSAAVRAALERAQDEHGVHAAGAGNADDLDVGGVIQAVGTRKVRAGVGAPVAAKGNDLGFERLYILHIASTSAMICRFEKPFRSIAPDGQATVQAPQP